MCGFSIAFFFGKLICARFSPVEADCFLVYDNITSTTCKVGIQFREIPRRAKIDDAITLINTLIHRLLQSTFSCKE